MIYVLELIKKFKLFTCFIITIKCSSMTDSSSGDQEKEILLNYLHVQSTPGI